MIEGTRNIYAVGANYAKHVAEMGGKPTSEPVIFGKTLASLTVGDVLAFPAKLGEIHHEVELVLRLGRDVPMKTFSDLGCVATVALGIDFTAREKQRGFKEKRQPWHLSKNFRCAAWVGFGEAPVAPTLPISFALAVNGETRQQGHSGQMLYSFTDILRFLNQTLDLFTGDLIFTGTPEGVGPVCDGDTLQVVSAPLGIDRALRVTIED